MEADSAVHDDRISHHGFDGVEADAIVADLARFGDDAIRQDAAQPLAAKLRAQVEALHLTDAQLEFVQSDAACEVSFTLGEEQAAFRWSIVTRKSGELLVEILEAQAEPEGLRVLEE